MGVLQEKVSGEVGGQPLQEAQGLLSSAGNQGLPLALQGAVWRHIPSNGHQTWSKPFVKEEIFFQCLEHAGLLCSWVVVLG